MTSTLLQIRAPVSSVGMAETLRVPTRKAPPPFVKVEVSEVEAVNPRLMRLQLRGGGLGEMDTPQPAASIRLLVPTEPGGELVIPKWNGNEFLLPDGSRPALRTFTPLRFDPVGTSIGLEIVRHAGGAVSSWAEGCSVGDPAALSGPGSGWEPPADLERLLVFGDETAVPAVLQILEAVGRLDPTPECAVHIEVTEPEARRQPAPGLSDGITWHVSEPGRPPLAGLVEVAQGIDRISDGTHIWAAGEAAAVQAMRKHFLRTLGVPRERTSIRGYWKSR